MSRLFGTDGIRGVANTYPLTPEMLLKLGMVVGTRVCEKAGGILVGRDSRRSDQPLLQGFFRQGQMFGLVACFRHLP